MLGIGFDHTENMLGTAALIPVILLSKRWLKGINLWIGLVENVHILCCFDLKILNLN